MSYQIRTPADATVFYMLCNSLHDGIITSVNYTAPITTDRVHNSYGTLVLRILVPSISTMPTVELTFHHVRKWQISSKSYIYGSIFDCSYPVFPYEKTSILWADAPSSRREDLKNATYVSADEVEWRFVEENRPKSCVLDTLAFDVVSGIIASQSLELTGILQKQWQAVTASKRTLFSRGFSYDFTLSPHLEPADRNLKQLGEIEATIPALTRGMGFILWLKNGYICQLEGYTYEEDLPQDVSGYKLWIQK